MAKMSKVNRKEVLECFEKGLALFGCILETGDILKELNSWFAPTGRWTGEGPITVWEVGGERRVLRLRLVVECESHLVAIDQVDMVIRQSAEEIERIIPPGNFIRWVRWEPVFDVWGGRNHVCLEAYGIFTQHKNSS